jgi:hypothetical protein
MLGKLIATLVFRTKDNLLIYLEVFDQHNNQSIIDLYLNRYELVDTVTVR